jgi:hypothetical protein
MDVADNLGANAHQVQFEDDLHGHFQHTQEAEL